MARQVLPIVGAVVGAYFGGAAGAQAGWAIGSLVGNAVDPLVINGPKIGDNGVQTSAEGAIRPVVYGTGPVVGNVITRGNRQIKKKKQRQGKGGPVTVTEHVYWTFAIRICEGPIAAVTRIWEDEKLVYDIRPGSPIVEESAEYAGLFTLYLGDEDQLPDPDLEVYKGMGNVNAHHGTAYIVFPNYDLTDRRESIPNYRFEVATVVESVNDIVDSMVVQNDGNSIISPDGTDWSASSIGGPLSSYLMAGSDRYVRWSATAAYYLLAGTTAWVPSTGSMGGSGGKRDGVFFNEQFLIAGGINGLLLSGDGAATFSALAYPAFPRSNHLAATDSLVATVSLYSANIWTAGNPSGTWTEKDAHGVNLGSGGSMAGSPSGFKIGGSDGALPKIVSTASGTGVSTDSLPSLVSATRISALKFGNGRWIAGTDSGETIYWTEDEGWQVGGTLPASVNGIDFNGQVFILVTSSGIYTTSDSVTMTLRRSGSFDAVASLAFVIEESEIGQPVPLGGIVSAVHGRARQASSKYDVSELTDMVDGVVLQADFSCADAIRAILPPYFTDASEYNGKIWYPKRGKAVVKTLTIDDLVDDPEDTTRDSAIEYPRKLHMFFMNPIIGYAPAKATAPRSSPDVRVVGERTVQIPVVVDDVDEAAQICDKLMKTAWAEAAGETTLTVTDEHMDLVNADCVGVLIRGQVSRRRIISIEDNPGTRKLTLRNDRQSAVTSNVTGIPLPPPTPPRPSLAGLTISEFLDLPALTDLDDDLHYLVAATGQTEAWSGALVQRSTDAGANYVDAAEFNGNTAMGVLLDPVSDASEFYTDTTNTVRLQLYLPDEIDSLTDAQFLSRGGGFALEKPDGTWEVMQYRDAVDEGDNTVALSHLQRGRLNSGTEQHLVGARFVLFDLLRKVAAVTAWIDQSLTHRAVSFNTSPEIAIPYTDIYTAKSQTEWPVVDFYLNRDGSDVIIGNWNPRHRFGTEDNPVQSINFMGYRVTVDDGVLPAVVFDTPINSIFFDASALGTPVSVTVQSLNRFTGPGPAVSESV